MQISLLTLNAALCCKRYSLQIGLSFEDVRMAVLVQRVVPAHYAFVIHTRNPSNNDPNEIFCELVRGL
eukprot:scaffold155060_cov20-Tisochrysis_lutea.AAC.1